MSDYNHSTGMPTANAYAIAFCGFFAAVGIVGFGALKWLRTVERASQMWNDEADL